LKAGLQAIRPMMKLAGLSMDRLVVHRHVFAQEIFLPMEGGCQDPVYNTWQLLHMRQHFMKKLNIVHVCIFEGSPSTYFSHSIEVCIAFAV
jgi:hypothetical protein